MKNLFSMLLISLISTCHWAPSYAQTRDSCAPRELVLKRLAERYGETIKSVGLHQEGSVVETYASDEGEHTWTILITDANGKSCLLAAGKWFVDHPTRLSPPGDDL